MNTSQLVKKKSKPNFFFSSRIPYIPSTYQQILSCFAQTLILLVTLPSVQLLDHQPAKSGDSLLPTSGPKTKKGAKGAKPVVVKSDDDHKKSQVKAWTLVSILVLFLAILVGIIGNTLWYTQADGNLCPFLSEHDKAHP